MEKVVCFRFVVLCCRGRRSPSSQRHLLREKSSSSNAQGVCPLSLSFSIHRPLTQQTHPHITTTGLTLAEAMTTTKGSAARGVFRRGGSVLVVLSVLLGAAMMVQANDKTRPFTRLQSTTGGGAEGGQPQQHPQQEELLERQQQRRRRRLQEAASGSDRKSRGGGKGRGGDTAYALYDKDSQDRGHDFDWRASIGFGRETSAGLSARGARRV